jgi:excisionase family DNA binding protein
MEATNEPKPMTIKQVANFLEVPKEAVETLIAGGVLRTYRCPKQHRRVVSLRTLLYSMPRLARYATDYLRAVSSRALNTSGV